MLSSEPLLLVAALRREHQALRDALERARFLGPSTAEGRGVLLGIEEPLAAHMAKESAVVYPALERAAAADPTVAVTVQVFATDGEAVAKAGATVFARVRAGEGGLALARDFGRLRGLLLERMR